MNARLLTWWTILRICLEERLVYRGDFALGTLMRFLPIVTQIFLWWAVFSAARAATAIAGYTYHDFVAYYLLTMVSRGVFQHARAGLRDRAADPRRRNQEVSHPADRHDRLSAPDAVGPQTGLLRGGDRPVCAGLFSLPRLLSRLAAAGRTGGLSSPR